MRTLNAPRNFFTDAEQACAAALLGLLTGQDDDQRIPLLEMVDAQLAAGETGYQDPAYLVDAGIPPPACGAAGLAS